MRLQFPSCFEGELGRRMLGTETVVCVINRNIVNTHLDYGGGLVEVPSKAWFAKS